MKKVFSFIVLIIFSLILSSCTSDNNKIEPIKTETVDFDMQIAKQMIEKGEKIISNIAVKEKVSRQEYNEFLRNVADAYDGYKEMQWEYMFFYNNEFENTNIDTLRLQGNMFYPTIYHQGIEIVSAKVTNTYYQNEFFNTSILTIREEYLGQDSKIKDWFREYIYKNDDKGNWIFHTFSGTVNLSGENFTPAYLTFK